MRWMSHGAVPEPLLPPRIALQNPELVGGYPFHVDIRGEQIVVMIDSDGDENYVPFVVPLSGGFPQPLAPETFAGRRSHLVDFDPKASVAYFAAESREQSLTTALRVHLETGQVDAIGESMYGAILAAWSPDHERAILADGYTVGDMILYEPHGDGTRRLLYGTPLEERTEGVEYPPNGVRSPHWVESGQGLLLVSSLVEDTGSFGFLSFDTPGEVEPVAVEGSSHEGAGELESLAHLEGDRYSLRYNIDGCSWAYDALFDEPGRRLIVERVLVGEGELAGGVLHGLHYDEPTGRFALAFCTATMPTQLYVLDAKDGPAARKTSERPLGISSASLAAGEDASFESHDGLRVSARLYLPAEELGYEGPRPLVYYVHGGPQGQERPNFAWFSMPLIQILALEGFAVFVPNARGSTGYGLSYTKHVDRDWGGLDRLDHVHAMTEVLPQRRASRRRARRSRRPLVRRLHDAHARRPPSGAVEGRRGHVRAVRPADVLGADPRDLEAVLRARARRPARRIATSSSSALRRRRSATFRRRCSSSRVRTIRASSSRSPTTSSRSCARRERTSTTSSSPTRGTTSSSCRTASAATTRSSVSSPGISPDLLLGSRAVVRPCPTKESPCAGF